VLIRLPHPPWSHYRAQYPRPNSSEESSAPEVRVGCGRGSGRWRWRPCHGLPCRVLARDLPELRYTQPRAAFITQLPAASSTCVMCAIARCCTAIRTTGASMACKGNNILDAPVCTRLQKFQPSRVKRVGRVMHSSPKWRQASAILRRPLLSASWLTTMQLYWNIVIARTRDRCEREPRQTGLHEHQSCSDRQG